jgi:hypothetical protein
VNYVLSFDGDAVDQNVNRTNLKLLTVIHALGRPAARVFATGNSATGNPVNQSR